MLKKGKDLITTKATKNKMKKVKDLKIKILEFKKNKKNYDITIEFNKVIEPYVRHRVNAIMKKNNESNNNEKNKKSIIGFNLYDPLNKYKDILKNILSEELEKREINFQLAEGNINLDIEFYIIPPKNFSEKAFIFSILKKFLPLTKPDVDNVAKTIMDICTNIIWKDDKQINNLSIKKFYGLNEKTIVHILADIKSNKPKGRLNNKEKLKWKKLILKIKKIRTK